MAKTSNKEFLEAYNKLNPLQKEAVDAIDGPVMVVAGPGTGKTQVLAIRIANILNSDTQTKANEILCLTFTNAGVHAMRERLARYIGASARDVKVSTFHSYAQRIIEKNYTVLGLDASPEIIDEQKSILLFDELLSSGQWNHLRPRGNPSQYFHDLKSLISLLKRENISPSDFGAKIDKEIESLRNDPSSISSRGESKGQLKKEIQNAIASLERSREAVIFYDLYEKTKKERLLMDYDDVLSYALDIVRESDDVAASIREESQYILVDEHQDSSGIQNAFLEAIWKETEKPNIFVVGDDRQLIYAFGGASISYFEAFAHTFGKARIITLTENYRSTQAILDTADALLSSHLASGPLQSTTKERYDIELYSCEYERDEILLAGILFKKYIKNGVLPENCALLVPKNKHVRSATRILRDMGLSVSNESGLSFFDLPETDILRNILRIVLDPYDGMALGEIIFAPHSNINPLEAHAFIKSVGGRELSLQKLLEFSREKTDLFSDVTPINMLGKKIEMWMNEYAKSDIYSLVQAVGTGYFLETANDHEALVRGAEVTRTYLHLVASLLEKNPKTMLREFLDYLDRLESYHHPIPLAAIGGHAGIKVLTLHGSKGLEFEAVHIAHMNESTIMKGKKKGFVLPTDIEHMMEAKDELTAKRELYVALTRAKKYLSLSYSLEPARIADEIADSHMKRFTIEDSIKMIAENPRDYVESHFTREEVGAKELAEIVKGEYAERNVSVTLLNNFFECPWKWYFNNFLQLPIPKSESLVVGSVVHTAIESILKLNAAMPAANKLDLILEDALDCEKVFEENNRARIKKDAKYILEAWGKAFLPTLTPSYMTERSVSYHDKHFPHLKMYGKIDLTEKLDGSLRVTDFKTGSSKTKNIIEKRDENGRLSGLLRQLAMYSYLLSDQKVSESRLLFLEENPKDKNATYATHIGQEEIDLLVRDIKEYDEALSTGSWVDRDCCFKPYAAGDDDCPFCSKAKIYNIEKRL